ncbi:hypothetical protein T484DRAFT_1938538 [Baffinella frigidus]|nr:hypothetical protein T484DRAFT_1938538 [Cryptophyta sp. CCMP2293]
MHLKARDKTRKGKTLVALPVSQSCTLSKQRSRPSRAGPRDGRLRDGQGYPRAGEPFLETRHTRTGAHS